MQIATRLTSSTRRRPGHPGAASLFCGAGHGRALTLAGMLLLVSGVQSGPGQALFNSEARPERGRTADILHYRLTLGFDEDRKTVSGTTSLTLTPLAHRLDSIALDAVEMAVTGVRADGGRAVSFRNVSPLLVVRFARPVQRGDTVTLSIDHSSRPRRGLYFVGGDSSGAAHREIWSQGEDTDNRYWFPCWDAPDDKATSEVIATVREDYTVLSNGVLVGEKHNRREHTRTYHWSQIKKHSAYLIMVAAGRFAVAHDRSGVVPLSYYVPPEDSGKIGSTFASTGKIIRFFERLYGVPFPWAAYAQIVIDDFMWGGMENTTAATLNESTVVDSVTASEFPPEYVISHEIAHMWWGDLVTVSDWSDLWLHEGMATYGEALYTRETRGEDEFQYSMIQSAVQVRAVDQLEGRSPIVGKESLPTNLYARGAWVLHMLRDVVGDEHFLAALHLVLVEHAERGVATRDLRDAIRRVTGRDLSWFFDQWLYKGGYPKLNVASSWDREKRMLSLDIAQTQAADSMTGVFRFPLHLQVTTDAGARDTVVEVNSADARFLVPVNDEPRMVLVDRGYHLLREMEFTKSAGEWKFQLIHAADIADRITAAYALADLLDDSSTANALEHAVMADRSWQVRQAALSALGDAPGGKCLAAFRNAARDSAPSVRSTAVQLLCRYGSGPDAALVDSLAVHDPGVLTVCSAIRELPLLDTAAAFARAIEALKRTSYRNLVQESALAALTRLHASDAVTAVVPLLQRNVSRSLRMQAATFLGDVCRETPVARSAVISLLSDHDPLVRRHAVRTMHTWNSSEFHELFLQKKQAETDAGVLEEYRHALQPDSTR